MTREEAINRLKNTAWLGTNKDREETEKAVELAIEALQDRPTGKWLKRQTVGDVDFAYCSKCGKPIIHGRTSPLWSYCPNCGADMRGEKEE